MRPPVRHSALYVGAVRHRRFEPAAHHFRYAHAMLYLDLGELDTVFEREPLVSVGRPNLAWFRRSDYLGDPSVPLDVAVGDLVETRTGRRPRAIRMLTMLRTLGYVFNPVTFYYCFDARDRLETVVAEITNTPWLERHAYVLSGAPGRARSSRMRSRFPKEFHVSPFLPMDIEHDWRFTEPGKRLHVHMEDVQDGRVVLDATLALTRVPLGGRRYTNHVLRHPLATFKVTTGIYLQALRLWWKRTPLRPHPKHAITRAESLAHAASHDRHRPSSHHGDPRPEGTRATRPTTRARAPAGALGGHPPHP